MDHPKFSAYSESELKVAQQQKPMVCFVTISRQSGAGGITVGEKFANYFHAQGKHKCPWTVFDKSLINEIIKDHNMSQRMLTFLKEDTIEEIQDAYDDAAV